MALCGHRRWLFMVTDSGSLWPQKMALRGHRQWLSSERAFRPPPLAEGRCSLCRSLPLLQQGQLQRRWASRTCRG
eukprot:scaffold161811_cov22-Tisochrysis_lutea.AAC.2